MTYFALMTALQTLFKHFGVPPKNQGKYRFSEDSVILSARVTAGNKGLLARSP